MKRRVTFKLSKPAARDIRRLLATGMYGLSFEDVIERMFYESLRNTLERRGELPNVHASLVSPGVIECGTVEPHGASTRWWDAGLERRDEHQNVASRDVIGIASDSWWEAREKAAEHFGCDPFTRDLLVVPMDIAFDDSDGEDDGSDTGEIPW